MWYIVKIVEIVWTLLSIVHIAKKKSCQIISNVEMVHVELKIICCSIVKNEKIALSVNDDK